jgi:hypothetical protein
MRIEVVAGEISWVGGEVVLICVQRTSEVLIAFLLQTLMRLDDQRPASFSPSKPSSMFDLLWRSPVESKTLGGMLAAW